MHYPDFESFSHLSKGVHFVPVYRRLIGDSLTPVSAFHKLDTSSSACLFESVVGGEKVGRYSFLSAEPFRLCRGIDRRVAPTDDGDTISHGDVMQRLTVDLLDEIEGFHHVRQFFPGNVQSLAAA